MNWLYLNGVWNTASRWISRREHLLGKTAFRQCRHGLIVIWLAACCLAAGLARGADVYYEVGADQTYSTILAALTVVPSNTFTANHIINIHAGSYPEVNVSTDPNNYLTGTVSRASVDKRLIIQAKPGDMVSWDATSGQSSRALKIYESHVTVQGIKFVGKTNDGNTFYIQIQSNAPWAPAIQRGGLIVYNCEFVGATPITSSYDDPEPGVTFTFAVINNYIHHFEFDQQVPGDSKLQQFYGGNVFNQWGTAKGVSMMMPRCGAGYATRWFLNNTFYSVGGNLTGFLRWNTTPLADQIVWANTIGFMNMAPTNNRYGYFTYAPMTVYPTMANNIQYGGQVWGKVNPTLYTNLTDWNTMLTGYGQQETNSYQADPLFLNQANSDFRLTSKSPAVDHANGAYWDQAIADLGISGLLNYWNPALDIGYQRGTPTHIGALKVVPAGTIFKIY